MEQDVLRKLWDSELKMLNEVDRICRKHHLTYFLMWGTLIGAVRHKGFIPWDDDIDISMPRDDYKKFIKIAKKELGEEFVLQTELTDKWYPMFFAKIRLKNTAFYALEDKNIKREHGIFIDIIPLDERKEKLSAVQTFKKKVAGRITNHLFNKRDKRGNTNAFLSLFPDNLLIRLRDSFVQGKGDYYTSFGYVLKKADFFPAIELEFEGQKYFAPNNYDKILTEIYGEYMVLPPEEKRVAHTPCFISFDVEKDREGLQKYLEGLDAE